MTSLMSTMNAPFKSKCFIVRCDIQVQNIQKPTKCMHLVVKIHADYRLPDTIILK